MLFALFFSASRFNLCRDGCLTNPSGDPTNERIDSIRIEHEPV
jgi:hypothetical protein